MLYLNINYQYSSVTERSCKTKKTLSDLFNTDTIFFTGHIAQKQTIKKIFLYSLLLWIIVWNSTLSKQRENCKQFRNYTEFKTYWGFPFCNKLPPNGTFISANFFNYSLQYRIVVFSKLYFYPVKIWLKVKKEKIYCVG